MGFAIMFVGVAVAILGGALPAMQELIGVQQPVFMATGVFIIFVGLYVQVYNRLAHLRLKVKEAWAGIDVQLKRRHDLIPRLVDTVKGYAKHESETLQNVTQARVSAMNTSTTHGTIESENALTGTLKSLFAVAESYPELKANENFLDLQDELSETEDRLAAARRLYNGNVTIYNTSTQQFPTNIVASIHSFKEAELYDLEDSEREDMDSNPPEISF